MPTENVQDLVEFALERAIASLDLIATDPKLDRELRETQHICNRALTELRGFGYEVPREEWQQRFEEN